MKLEWNRVTWYSKAIALGIFVALVIAAFWFGVGCGELVATVAAKPVPSAASSSSVPGSAGAEYYGNVAEWQTSQNRTGGFSIGYPIDFSVGEYDLLAPSTEWSFDNPNGTSGDLFFTLAIPRSFEPQTNFADATLSVGASANAVDVARCATLTLGGGPMVATSTATINGIAFTVLRSASAGAGNYYETTSYRTLHAGQCYAIEYTIHSSQIANYPASYNLHPFDEKPIADLLDRIVGTFKFK